MKKRFSEEQILREAEQTPDSIRDVCRRHNITGQTCFRWRNTHGGMDISEVRRLKEPEAENTKLKKIVAEQALAIDGLSEINRKCMVRSGFATVVVSSARRGLYPAC